MNYSGQTIILPAKTEKALLDAVLCSAGFAAFAFFVADPFPSKLAAFIPLFMSAFIISRTINWSLVSFPFLFRSAFSHTMPAFNIIGLLMGIAGAMYYRGSFGMPVLPAVIRAFIWVAICIAVMEELLFRGFIQGRLSGLHPGFAILFAAFAHASYKACLFLSPAVRHHPSLALFYTWTFGASLLIGLLSHYSKSILPAIIAHVVFDIIVYAENLQAPWWVW